MPANAFNVGRDASLVLTTSDGGVIRPVSTILMDFGSKPMTADIKIVGLDGILRSAYLPEGWEGTFTYQRADATFDDYFAALEANYYAGSDLPSGVIQETITELDGSISQYLYTKISLKFSDAGTWSGNKAVEQKLDFMASRRIKTL